MSEILHDAAFTTLEVTDQLIFRDRLLIDNESNIYANTVYANCIKKASEVTDGGISSQRAFDMNSMFSTGIPSSRSLPSPETNMFEGFGNSHGTDSVAVGGTMNNAIGVNSGCLVGEYNKTTGKNSVIAGGRDNNADGLNSVVVGGRANYAKGVSSTACGTKATASHDNSFAWNGNPATPCETSMNYQFMVGSNNGLFFRMPKSSDVPGHLIPTGYSVWCWDADTSAVCLKTNTDGVHYKSVLPTSLDIIKVELNVTDENGVSVSMNNPDLS